MCMMVSMEISASQCRAARALLNWTQGDLAEASGVSKRAIADFETGNRRPIAATLTVLRQALESGGVQFVPHGVANPIDPQF